MENQHKIIQTIIDKLSSQHQTISFAESCTGGQIVSKFTAISGVSSILNGSCITYSNEIKHQWLNVKKETLEEFGAVSKECVIEMLHGMIDFSKSDYAIAVSGIAGPSGGTAFKPVGTVYIGIYTPTKEEIFHSLFKGDRENIQKQATQFAIENLASMINIKNF